MFHAELVLSVVRHVNLFKLYSHFKGSYSYSHFRGEETEALDG